MSLSRKLVKQDIVGHRIKNIWLTDWIVTPDCDNTACKYDNTKSGYFVQKIYIELDSGVFFEIQPYIEDYPVTVPQIKEIVPDFNKLHLERAFMGCVGLQIVEVLVSEYLPSHCLLLNNTIIIYCADYSQWEFGPKFNKLTSDFFVDEKDFFTYWEGESICVENYCRNNH